MIRIDDSLLEEIGLISLPKQERDQMLRQIYETLEMRVGMRLAERMTDQQLDEFERFIDTNDEAGALKWLESNFPDYKQVVADELEKLKTEIKADAPKIIQAMQGQGGSVLSPDINTDNSTISAQQQPPAASNINIAPQPQAASWQSPEVNSSHGQPNAINNTQAEQRQPVQIQNEDDSSNAGQSSGPGIPPPPVS